MSEEYVEETEACMDPDLMDRLQAKLAEEGKDLEGWLQSQAGTYLEDGNDGKSVDVYQSIVESTSECIVVISETGVIEQINAAGLKMVGSNSADELLGTSLLNLVATECHEDFLAYHTKICSGERWSLPFDLISKEGTRRHVESNGVPFECSDGGVGQLATMRDVTTAHEAEDKRRRVTETLSAVIEQSPMGIYVVDSQLRISQLSAGAKAAFREVYPIIGRELGDLMRHLWPDDFAQFIVEIFHHTLKTGETYISPGLTKERKDSGSTESYEWQVIRVTLADGQFGAVCYFFDATRLQDALSALRESESRFRMLADNISQLAWTCVDLGNVDWYNQRWLDYTGLSFEELRNQGWQKVHHPDHVDRVVAGIERSRRNGEGWKDTFPLRGRDGTYRWFLSQALPIRNEQGEIIRWFGSNTDVTELRETQQLLRDADRRKDEFLATLAHELRNPLAPIRTGLEVMRMAKDKPDVLEKVRNTMERQTQQLVSLVDDLINVSRITQGKLELCKDRIDFAEAIEDAAEASRTFIDEGGHDLTIESSEQPVFIEADRNRMIQIISNLLNNAAKYTPDGGKIRLSVRTVDDHVELSVEDNGIGIPEEMADRVFEMFAQIERAGDTGYSGLGIGLSLVKSLVEMHDGTINVYSEGPDRGSVFTVRLPVSAGMNGVSPNSAVEEVGEGAMNARKVLIVDDNEEAATTLSLAVDLLGHEVEVAHDGEKAIEIAGEFRPDLIFMDLGMPVMDGYESARCIREKPWGQSLTLVALTGWGLEDDRRKTKEAGFDDHLVKPADPSVLKEMIASVGKENGAKS